MGLPLYYDRQSNCPAKQMTLSRWDTLNFKRNTTPGQPEQTLDLLQVDHEQYGKDVLHVCGNTAFLETKIIKACLIVFSVFAATAYVSQYAIIKSVRAIPEFRSFPSYRGYVGRSSEASLSLQTLEP